MHSQPPPSIFFRLLVVSYQTTPQELLFDKTYFKFERTRSKGALTGEREMVVLPEYFLFKEKLLFSHRASQKVPVKGSQVADAGKDFVMTVQNPGELLLDRVDSPLLHGPIYFI